MKLISRYFPSQAQSGSSSDTGWENQTQNLNTEEDTPMDIGSVPLSKSSSQCLSVVDQRTKLIAEVKLNKIFTDHHFSICALNDLMAMLGKGRRKSKVYKQLQALHCVEYDDMSEDLKAQLPLMINELLTNTVSTGIAAQTALNNVFNQRR